MTIDQVFNMMKDIRKPTGKADEELINSFGLDKINAKENEDFIRWNNAKSKCMLGIFI